jgi:hypothetical protein
MTGRRHGRLSFCRAYAAPSYLPFRTFRKNKIERREGEPHGPAARQALWSFVPVEGDVGMLVNHRDATLLVASTEDGNQKHTQKAIDGDLYGYSIFVRDAHYNTELDRRDWPQKWQQQPPPYFNDPANDRLLQAAIDGYRDHLRKVHYSFKYRYFHALRPLLSIADETQKLCDQMWGDPLMATEFSYVARTTPEHT